ncbi:hypothetical protein SAMN04488005_0207 [Yoonia tamlensis]|uniref:Transferrin-binding protein B C-lobe/N-lobe beta-barrel domain-containing protein n=2 Tax=Yoonia tamlensis TaxID=390270 RepID=A0A1I6FPN8_9RHOB|nr:hypothetical protein SAMN04488005_0207 [Yoonia tamlensis]
MRTGAAANYTYTHLASGGSPDRVLRTLPNAGWYYYPDTLAGVPADFSVYLQTTEGYLLRGTTSGGEVIIVDNGAQLTRTGTTVIPATGSAAYSGTYGAIVVDGSRDLSPETVSGTATLTVNFAYDSVTGMITNRVFDGTTAADDVTLNLTDLVDGAFVGSTSGGALNSGGLVAADGTYTGLIVGPNGEAIVGAVTISHAGPNTFTEQGGMVLTR